MPPTPPHYRAYLLRLWRVGESSEAEKLPIWRASLEDPHTGERLAFATLGRLFAFLSDQTAQADPDDRPNPPGT